MAYIDIITAEKAEKEVFQEHAKLAEFEEYRYMAGLDEDYGPRFEERMYESSVLISSVARLASSRYQDVYYDTAQIQHAFTPQEKKFIKAFGILNRYVSNHNITVESIRLDAQVESYYTMCLMIGLASVEATGDYDVDYDDLVSIYDHLVLRYTGAYHFPSNTKAILESLRDVALHKNLTGSDRVRDFNFLQKAAIKNHGLQFIFLGNLIGIHLNNLEVS